MGRQAWTWERVWIKEAVRSAPAGSRKGQHGSASSTEGGTMLDMQNTLEEYTDMSN